MKYEEWPYHPTKLPVSPPELEVKLRELRAHFVAELRQNPKVTEYLKDFDPKWGDKFIEDYASAKVEAVHYSNYHMEAMETIEAGRELRYRKETEKVFDVILQKKLFNLQCLWRAEQITLPEVRTTWDFLYWSHNIRSCPFIEPVTRREIDLMREFLRTDNCDTEPLDWLVDWQDYEAITGKEDQDEEEGNDCVPDWYEFYDARMGTGALMQLPDLRTPKENAYRHLYHEEQAELRKQQPPSAPYVPSKPSIHCSMEERYKFSQVVDDPIFQRIFLHDLMDAQERSEAEEGDEGEDPMDIIILHLDSIKNPPPVRGGLSWREAIRQCWRDYLNGVIAEDLDLVWNEYLMYLEAGIVPAAEDKMHYKSLADDVAQQILRGRVLSGEPEDLNF